MKILWKRVAVMNKKFLKVVILSLSCYLSSAMSVSGALANIAKAYPTIDSSSIQMIVSLPSILIIPFCLIAGALSNKISKKLMIFIGMILLTIGGVGPSFMNSFTYIMISRCVLGVGIGLITPFATGLIADFYDGPERAGMIGMQAATNGFASSVLSFVAGVLCTFNWHYTFLVYILGAVIAMLVFFKLPEPAKVPTSLTEKAMPNAPVIGISILIFFYYLFLFCFYNNTALVIVNENLGNSASAGTTIALFTLGGLSTAMLFGKLSQLFKRFTIIWGIALTTVGFFILSSAHIISLMFLGAVVIGLGSGIIMPCTMLNITLKAPKAATSLSIAIVISFINIGSFISPVFFKIVGQLLKNTTERFTFSVSSVFFAAAFVIFIIATFVSKKSVKGTTEAKGQ